MHGFQQQSRVASRLQFRLQSRNVAERHGGAVGKERSESLSPEVIAHERKRAHRESVKGAFGVKKPVASCVGPGKLHGSLYAFTAGAAKENLRESASRTGAKLRRQLPGKIGNVTLNHRRPFPAQFVFERFDHRRVVVPRIVNTIAGQKIQNRATVVGLEPRSPASRVANIHPQYVQQPHPLRVHAIAVKRLRVIAAGNRCFVDQFRRRHRITESN